MIQMQVNPPSSQHGETRCRRNSQPDETAASPAQRGEGRTATSAVWQSSWIRYTRSVEDCVIPISAYLTRVRRERFILLRWELGLGKPEELHS